MKKRFYILSILILFLFNVNNVFAIETDFTNLSVQGYNNNGNSLTTPSVFNCSVGSCGMEITTIANSYGGAWGIQSPIPLIQNHQYAITLRIRTSNGTINLSSKPNIALGSSMALAKSNYETNNYYSTTNYSKSIGNQTLQYVITPQFTLNYLIIPFTTTTNTTASFMIDNIIIDDLGASSLTQAEINNILNIQTSVLQSDINNLQSDINNTIKDNFNTCGESKNLLNLSNFTTTTVSGVTITRQSNGTFIFNGTSTADLLVTIPINLTLDSGTYTHTRYSSSSSVNAFLSLDNLTETMLNVHKPVATWTLSQSKTYNSYFIWIGSGLSFNNVKVDLQIEKGSVSTSYEPYGEVCKNKLDSLNDTQKETNDKLDNLNDNITNSDSSEASGEAGDFFSNFNTDTFGLTSVITAPLELIKSITSKTCSPLHGTLPFVSTEVNLPCLSSIYENHFGTFLTIYRTITFGFVSYWVCIKIFNLVKDFKNPEHDEIEVLDL